MKLKKIIILSFLLTTDTKPLLQGILDTSFISFFGFVQAAAYPFIQFSFWLGKISQPQLLGYILKVVCLQLTPWP